MKKYAFVLMGNYDPARHTAEFTVGSSLTRICTVRSFEAVSYTHLDVYKRQWLVTQVMNHITNERGRGIDRELQ